MSDILFSAVSLFARQTHHFSEADLDQAKNHKEVLSILNLQL